MNSLAEVIRSYGSHMLRFALADSIAGESNSVSSITPLQATKFGGPKITLSGTFTNSRDTPALKFQLDDIETVMTVDTAAPDTMIFLMKRFNLPSDVSSADVNVLLALNGRDFQDTGFTINIVSGA